MRTARGKVQDGGLARAALLLLAVLACIYTYRLEKPETHTWPAAGITGLSVTTRNGAVTVRVTADTVITAVVTRVAYGQGKSDAEKALANVVFSETTVAGELRLKADMPSGPRPYGAEFDVTCRESTAVALSTTNGDVKVTGMAGGLKASTTNGDIELVGTAGSAEISSTDGRLDVRVHRGAVAASTTNGAVECDLVVLAPTDSGRLETTDGDVTLLLPADVSAVIDARNTNGTLAVHDFTVIYEVQTEHHLRGRIGSGASAITITTTNGDVTIRRRS